jgi:hypothetical protein
MAITTLDGALAGMQAMRTFAKALSGTVVAGRPNSAWGTAGLPGAGSFSTSLAGAALTSTGGLVNGQIPHFDPVSGDAYLANLLASSNVAGTLELCDRLWHNGGFTITSATAQTVNSAAFPARDVAGTTNGDGVLLGLEVSAACGAAAPTITVSYTNQAGTAGRTATNLNATANSPAAGAFYKIGLQAGDTGVRSVQSLTLSASWVSGTINLVAYRPLAVLPLASTNVPAPVSPISGGFPILFDGTVPFLLFTPSAATTFTLMGSYQEAQG